MCSRARNRHPLTRVVRAMLLALVLSSCASASSATAQPDGQAGADDNAPPSAVALVDRPHGQPQLDILTPLDGAVVTSPVRMIVTTSGLTLAGPGSPVDGEGHWHVLVNQGCLPAGAFIPDNEKSIHIGSDSNAADIDLPVGTHELCVQVGDGFHVAINVHDTITLTVVE